MQKESRNFNRFNTVVDGSFRVTDSAEQGACIMTNYSRSGCKASLSSPVAPGKLVELGMRFPANIFPQFAVGRIIWITPKAPEGTYRFDTGIKFEGIDALESRLSANASCKPWQIKQVADYAAHRGYLTKKFPEACFRFRYCLPSLLVLYLIVGTAFSLYNATLAAWFSASLAAYVLVMLTSSLALTIMNTKRGWLGKLGAVFISGTIGSIARQLCYGLYFAKGLLSSKIQEK